MKKKDQQIGPQVRVEKKPGKSLLRASIAFGSIVAGMQAATQVFAYRFNFHDALGANIGGLYAPWEIVRWATQYSEKFGEQIAQATGAGTMVAVLGLGLAMTVSAIRSNTSKAQEHMHGSARWAKRDDIERAGLLPRAKKESPDAPAVFVGAWEDEKGQLHYLKHSGPEHVLCFAPTRSGKGVGLVVPTLLSWTPSALITDLKGELWALTAGWRKKYGGNRVLRFEPASSRDCVKWNPLEEIRLGTDNEVGDVQNLATLLVDPDGKGLESHWQKTAQALLVGCILHLLYKAKNEGGVANMTALDKMLADPSRPVAALWDEMIKYTHIQHPHANLSLGANHPAVGTAGRDMIDRPEEEAGSVLSTAKSYLSLYRDPVVAENTRFSEFKIRDLMHADDPVSLYVVTQPSDKDRLRPLVRVLVNMSVRLLADRMDFKDGRPVAHYKHRLLMMLDEFPSLGKLDIIQESLAFVAGYGIKCYLITQDLSQLQAHYTKNESITSNCHVQNAYPPNRLETAQHLSRLTGQTTIVKEQITTSGKRLAFADSQVSRTMQEVSRPLLTDDECMRMPGPKKAQDGSIVEAGDMVVFVAGFPAIYGKQPLYFVDKVFSARAAIPAPAHTDRLHPLKRSGAGAARVEINLDA